MSSLTMGGVEELIATRRDQLFVPHEFMRRLDGSGDVEAVQRLLLRLAFFVFAFQDMLKVAHDACDGAPIKPIVRSLHVEDRGHDRWFALDLRTVGVDLTVQDLFAPEHGMTREVTYALIRQLTSVRSDHARLAVLLTLEAAAHEFFKRIPRFAARSGINAELLYCGRTHLEAEESHEAFSEHGQAEMAKLVVPPDDVNEVLETIEKTCAEMVRLSETLASAMAG